MFLKSFSKLYFKNLVPTSTTKLNSIIDIKLYIRIIIVVGWYQLTFNFLIKTILTSDILISIWETIYHNLHYLDGIQRSFTFTILDFEQ